MAYFNTFGRVWFTLPSGEQILLNDITKFSGFKDQYKKNPGFYLNYKAKEGERPEQISKKLYGTGDYAWTILLFNDIYDIDNQWPLTQEQLEVFVDRKYPGQDYADILHYIDDDNKIAFPTALRIVHNLNSDEDAIGTFGLRAITIGDYETEINEKKRELRLIDPDHIQKVENDLREAFED